MPAAVVTGPREARLATVDMPEPRPGELLVRIEGCGVCGSNVPVWEGRPWFDYPLAAGAPGHEGWGVVERVGDGVASPEPGTRVAVLAERAFASVVVAPAANVVPVPRELDGQPFPGEALGCAMNVFRRSDVRAGQTVAVVGTGFLGLLLVQLCARAGARVLAVARRPSSLRVAREAGADDTVELGADAVERVTAVTSGALCSRVIEAAGVQETLDLAGAITRERGRLVVAGFHQDGPRQVDMQLWNWRGLDVVNAHERDPEAYVDGVRAAAAAVVDGRLDPSPLYTHRFPLPRISGALEVARTRPEGFVKALVTM